MPLASRADRFQVVANLAHRGTQCSGGRACDEDFVAYIEFAGLYLELRHLQFRVVAHRASAINLALGGLRAVAVVPLGNGLAQVIAVPETTIEDTSQPLVPFVQSRQEHLSAQFGVGQRVDGFTVAAHHRVHILRTTSPAFYLEHTHTCIHHLVDETDGFQILRRHNVTVLDVQFRACLHILHRVAPTAELHALATVGRTAPVALAQVAFAADGHAEGAMAEHLDAHRLSTRTANAVSFDGIVDFRHLLHVQLTCQNHHIGKLRIETQSLRITDVQLRAQVDFLPNLTAIKHHRHIAGNDSTDASLVGSIQNPAHQLQILTIDNGVHRQVTLNPETARLLGNTAQIVDGKRAGRVRTHVQVLNAKVNTVGTCTNSSRQALGRAHRGHDFKIFPHIKCKVTTFPALSNYFPFYISSFFNFFVPLHPKTTECG